MTTIKTLGPASRAAQAFLGLVFPALAIFFLQRHVTVCWVSVVLVFIASEAIFELFGPRTIAQHWLVLASLLAMIAGGVALFWRGDLAPPLFAAQWAFLVGHHLLASEQRNTSSLWVSSTNIAIYATTFVVALASIAHASVIAQSAASLGFIGLAGAGVWGLLRNRAPA